MQARAESPVGPVRAWLLLVGIVAWLAGPVLMLLQIVVAWDDAWFLRSWLLGVAGFGLVSAVGLSVLVRRRRVRWTFPGTLGAVCRAGGMPPMLVLTVVLLQLGALYLVTGAVFGSIQP
ncbi:hypothetical protein [Aquipuribacter sp. SD81]|uniref:hypothetical protein n=1 Tax=Aquipuribacter sp. SD81 TaxID=3127703 RepID=UPI003016A3CA